MPTHVDEFNRAAKAPIDLMAEFERASGSGDGEGDASGDSAQDPAPEAEIKVQRRRRDAGPVAGGRALRQKEEFRPRYG